MPPRWSLDSSRLGSDEEEDDDISCSSRLDERVSEDISALARQTDDDAGISRVNDDGESRDPSCTTSEAPPSLCLTSATSSSSFDSSGSSSLASSSASSSSLPKKSVRFSEFAKMHMFRLPPESSSAWYSPAELQSFRRDVIDTVDCIVAGNLQGSSSNTNSESATGAAYQDLVFCSRGCEIRTPMGTAVRQRHRLAAMRAVLYYQEECRRLVQKMRRQITLQTIRDSEQQHSSKSRKTASIKLTDVMKPEVVARLYTGHTKHSERQAQFMGQLDERQTSAVGRGCCKDSSTHQLQDSRRLAATI